MRPIPEHRSDLPDLSVNMLSSPDKSLGAVDAYSAANIIAAASDIALVLDPNGVICDLSFTSPELSRNTLEHWLGQPWIDTVTAESRPKVDQMLLEAGSKVIGKSRQINHVSSDGVDMPIRYTAVQLGQSGNVIAVGRDLRIVASLQQRLVDAQRAVERDYLRLRSAETRYRLLFQLSSEAVVIVDAGTMKLVDVNPSASSLLEATPGRLVGKPVREIFSADERGAMTTMLETARNGNATENHRIKLVNGRECFISASLFRQDDMSHLLVRLTTVTGEAGGRAGASQILRVVDALPDAFVVTDRSRIILEANKSFLDMAELTSLTQARGQSLDRWLGRASVDASVLFSNLQEHGSVRHFATVIRSDYGAIEDVEISGVSVPSGETPCYGLVIHSLRNRLDVGKNARGETGRSVAQLSELVGRIPLKDLVRETTELTERLCIEASLKLTGDNRAAAAQLLGLSRQSLYSKLRRYDLGADNDDEA